ncbi:ATP-dependent RNA helicase MSS116 mitochondrial precursor [Plenodomus tracheiphilus IPT5]|uniref:ATP-dependent RNA helicase n=1 Tax=Plenodomus tracheiphilus IPT5 TaxID=1408161 RepID=A0A6A7BFC2_9PLEO|nr:ATP-dependent RNA helicase MSS116 mitochondrial precursor [Plenodomus tracheiphilus IPT5]
MPPPPAKRKWPRRNGGERFNGGSATPSAPTTPRSALAQQPKRPKVDDAQPLSAGPIDVKHMYSTAAGDAAPRPFSDLQDKLNKGLLDGLDKMGFEYMSPVQQKVLTELPSPSSDCVVQAKTGTGKTVAFLVPAIQNLLAGNMPPRGKVAILVVCPTRELALQIAKECNGVTACLPHKMECHTAFGGTSRASNLKAFLNGSPTVLVATPGRLDDILGEEMVREKFSHLKTVILDEADQMLDAGFAPAVKKILRRIPPKSDGWQGMCFSATLPKEVLDIAKIVLFPGFTHLSTVDPNETPTHERVPQFYFSVPTIGQTFAALSALIEEEYNQDPTDFKAIVFGTTANGVGLLYNLYSHALPQFRSFELHSRMSQPARTRTTKDFKEAQSGILFASDVVGRGMDFPNVGLVIQLGLPSSTDQYVHRVGRTARAGKDGRAVLILTEQESFFPRVNRTLPIKPFPVDIVSRLPKHEADITRAFTSVDETAKSKAYQAFLGYNKTFLKKLQMSPADLVRMANDYARTMGCPEPPMMEKSTVGKMGLKGVPGLRIGSRR